MFNPDNSKNLLRRSFLGGSVVALCGAMLNSALGSSTAAAVRSSVSQAKAPTLFADIDGTRFAYRKLGASKGTPILLLHPFIGTMDRWDSLVVESFSRTRPVILMDNRGVGLSGGETPNTFDAMANDVAAFLDALHIKKIDVLGFSTGGMVAQSLVLTRPELVRRLILGGTGPRGGKEIKESQPDLLAGVSVSEPITFQPYIFSPSSEQSQLATQSSIEGAAQQKIHFDPRISEQAMRAKREAIQEWGRSAEGYISRLQTLSTPTLIVNGDQTLMVSSSNSYLLFKAIPKAQLVLYPGSGHGTSHQYAALFLEHANLFLDRQDVGLS